MGSRQVLKIVRNRDTLGLSSPEEVLGNRVRVVAKGNLDGSVKTMKVPVVAGSLVGFVLSHERQELLSRPAFGQEIIIIGGRRTGIHLRCTSVWRSVAQSSMLTYHEVDRGSTSKDVGTRDDSLAAPSHGEGRDS